MKIQQLPIGARFEYEGVEYVKTGPLFGIGKNGQRLIPKYARIKLLGAIDIPQPAEPAEQLRAPRSSRPSKSFTPTAPRPLPRTAARHWRPPATTF